MVQEGEHQEVDLALPQLPLGPVHDQEEPLGSEEGEDEAGIALPVQPRPAQEPLEPSVGGAGVRAGYGAEGKSESGDGEAVTWPATPCTTWTPNLKVPVWEVDLEGLAIREAGLFLPDFLDPEADGWLVLPEVLEARWRALPEEKREGLPRWWTTWDVATVGLRVWPEGRVRFLGTLGEVCPEEAVGELEAALAVSAEYVLLGRTPGHKSTYS